MLKTVLQIFVLFHLLCRFEDYFRLTLAVRFGIGAGAADVDDGVHAVFPEAVH
jgi:hypothetical protein